LVTTDDHPPGRVIPYSVFKRAQDERNRRSQVGFDATGGNDADHGEDEAAESFEEVRKLLRAELAALPEVRDEKIREVSRRIRDGFYDRPEVLTEVANRILNGFPAPDGEQNDRGKS
jgi:hypothetical protein